MVYIIKDKKSDNSYEGSVTVEMSLLFPIVVFVIATIMLMAFYISDIVSIRAKIYEYCINEADTDKTDEELKKGLQKELSDYTIIAQIDNVNVGKKDGKIKVTVNVAYRFGYFDLSRKDSITTVAYSDRTRDYIIRQKVIIDTIHSIK